MLLDLLPTSIAVLLPELSLLFIGYAVEKHYVSRVTCFTNVLALNVHFLTIGESGFWVGLYADFGLVLGIWGFLHYLAHEKLGEWYYRLSHLGYSSLVVASIILYPHIKWIFSAIVGEGSFPATGVVLFAVLMNLVLLADEDSLHYRLARPIDVNEFIANSPKIRYYLGDGYYSQWRRLGHWFDIK